MEKKILVIDHDRKFTDTIKASLEAGGEYQVMIENRGTHGLDAARKLKPDLILLNVRMPEISGFKVLAALKKDDKTMSIPVVMVTAVESEDTKNRAMRMYSAGYLVKPLTAEALKTKIEQILPKHKVDTLPEDEVPKEGAKSREEIKEPFVEKEQKVSVQKIHRPGRTKILVIDDEKANCDLMEAILAPQNFNVYTCYNPEEAMTFFSETKPDIVMLDLVMPKIDGMEILKRIKKLKTKVRVIVLTGVKDSLVIKDATALGADDIIIKPFSMDQINATLIKHLRLMEEER